LEKWEVTRIIKIIMEKKYLDKLTHEITKKLKSKNSEKDISFYSCSKNEKKV